MTLASNSVRIAKVVTGASAITAVYQIPQMYNSTNSLPLWTGFDPLSNRVYRTSPDDKLLGQAGVNSTQSFTATTTMTNITQFPNVSFIADGIHQVVVELEIPDMYWTGYIFMDVYLYDTTLGQFIGGQSTASTTGSNTDNDYFVRGVYTPAAGTHTIQVWVQGGSGSTAVSIAGGRHGWSPVLLTARIWD